ncbi:MAG: glycosyltransferase family 4 protein [Parcubacteria group bacterium]|jgi:glycosyltransferase involved in cell wall biosynthesis
MKILFFNYEYPPLGGGAGQANRYILNEFSKIEGLEVDLITSAIDNSSSVEKISEKITIYKVPIRKNGDSLHFQSQKDLILYAWKAMLLANKLVKINKYDLTHSFFTVPCGAISFWLRITKKIPYIISLRGSDVPGYSDRFKFIYLFLTPLIKLIWKKSGAVVSNSQGLKDLALTTNKEQAMGVIFNGTDIDNFYPDESLKNNDKFIITMGGTRITARKGINYLIEALSVLIPKYPNLFLRLVGEGNEKDNLKELVKELRLDNVVEFVGLISREKIVPYYQEAKLFVLPSLNEGMSNAMLEALAVGLPIIATETGGTDELVEDGINGFVVKMKDAQDLAEKIEIILKDKDLCRKMGQESREMAEKMSWKNVAGEYYELYKKVVNKK